ncbi:MAG: PEP-CTERM sorting domain-containing protein [Acidobacteriota bacterium]|nr:PEP-CTERM sorting domain-containing protein [Acidobacteriota bacterium]
MLAANIPSGYVAVATGNSTVKVFAPNGTLFETLNDASGSTYTTGMTFDNAGDLFVTNFSTNTVSKFNANGTLASSNYLSTGSTPESILINQAGSFLVAGPGSATIKAFSSAGVLTQTYNVQGGNGTGGTDWIDLAANQSTVLYDGEGTEILSYDLTTHTQNAAFATGLASSVFALRIIPAGAMAGDVLAADSAHAILLNSSGVIIKTYNLPGNNGTDFALNLDPNGTSFWTADTSGNVWEVDIATGTILQSWNSGSSSTFGLAVAGELTAGGPPPTNVTPEPGSLALLGTGLTSLTLLKNRFRRRR